MVKTLNKLIFTELRGRTVSVLASGNRVLQIGTAPEREDCALGTICVGRVRNIAKNINAAFVEYRPGINGYYSLAENRFHLFADGRDGSSPLKNGDEILVQISRAAVKTKDAVLTSKLSLTGQYGVLTLDGSGLGISSKIRDAGWKEQMKEWWEEEARGLVSGLSGTGLPRAGFILRTNAYGAPLEAVGLELSGQGGAARQEASSISRKAFLSAAPWMSGRMKQKRSLQIFQIFTRSSRRPLGTVFRFRCGSIRTAIPCLPCTAWMRPWTAPWEGPSGSVPADIWSSSPQRP